MRGKAKAALRSLESNEQSPRLPSPGMGGDFETRFLFSRRQQSPPLLGAGRPDQIWDAAIGLRIRLVMLLTIGSKA
jgi:hypothetical protein